MDTHPIKSSTDTYTVFWSPEDQEWVAKCGRQPYLSWLEADPVTALTGLTALLAAVEADMANDHRDAD